MASVINAEAWLGNDGKFQGEWQGAAHGAAISVIATRIEEVGEGPGMHRHPYAETFVIRLGTGLFTVGGRQIRATAGQILVVPANIPHAFENAGPGPFETIDIHENGSFTTEWLD